MDRTLYLIFGRPLVAMVAIGAAPLLAASSMLTDASLTVVKPSNAVTVQAAVTGSVTVPPVANIVIGSVALPLLANIGISAGAVSLPPATQINPLNKIRIGTESGQRQIVQEINRSGLQQASFTIIGDRDQVISISVPQTISLQQLGGEGEVEFNPATNLTANGHDGGRLSAGSDGTGELSFDVGGRLQSAPMASAGDYAGILKVTVQYN